MGEELPAEARAVVGRALDVTIALTFVRRGSYAEHVLQFAPAD